MRLTFSLQSFIFGLVIILFVIFNSHLSSGITEINYFRDTCSDGGQVWTTFEEITNTSCKYASSNWDSGIQLIGNDWNNTGFKINIKRKNSGWVNDFLIGYANYSTGDGTGSNTIFQNDYYSNTSTGIFYEEWTWLPNSTGIKLLLNNQEMKFFRFNATAYPTIYISGASSAENMLGIYNLTTYLDAGEIILNTPVNNSISYNGVFSVDVYPSSLNNITNATIFIWDNLNNLYYSGINNLTGNQKNTTSWDLDNIPAGIYSWGVKAFFINSTGINYLISANNTFISASYLNNYTYNSSDYETSYQNIKANLTKLEGSIISSVKLYYGGTAYTSDYSDIGNYLILNKGVYVDNGNNNILFEITYSNGYKQNISNATQVINNISLYQCSTGTNRFLNISFKNETINLENINASLSGTFIYSLSDISIINNSYSYSNSSYNSFYSFCFTPADRSINILNILSYNNPDSIQRNYYAQLFLTNLTTNKILYLLPSISGIYTRYKSADSNGETITGVLAQVYRTISGTSYLIASAIGDSAGLVIFYLNPDESYNFIFSKSGYTTTSFSLIPNSIETYTVVLGSGIQEISNGTQIYSNLSYSIYPVNLTLLNNTSYNFGFNVTGNNIDFISMNITNSTGYQIYYTSNGGSGYIYTNINTENLTSIIGKFIIDYGGEQIEVIRVWTIGEFYEGSYSLSKQLGLFKKYGFSQFWLFLFSCVIIIGVIAGLSYGEVLETTDSKIMVIILMVWFLSIIGWFDTGLAITSSSERINELSATGGKYGIAIVTSLIGGALILRRIST